MRVASRAVAVASLLLWGGAARAQVDSPLVRAGVAAYEALDYARAVSLLERARKERLTVDELAVTLKTLGASRIVLGDEAGARDDFTALLRVAPGTTMDRAISPRIRLVFEEVRAKMLEARSPEPPPPRPEPPSPGSPPVGAPPVGAPSVGAPSVAAPAVMAVRAEPTRPRAGAELVVKLAPPSDAAHVELSTRTAGAADYHLRRMYPGGTAAWRARISGDELGAPALELFAIAFSAAGLELARAGSPSAPIRLEVVARPTPVYKRGWFWGVIGGVAAAGLIAGVTAGVLVAQDNHGALVVVPR